MTSAIVITVFTEIHVILLMINSQYNLHVSWAYAGFLRGGAQLKNFWDFGYTCREAACREQRSCELLLGGFGGMPPKKIFLNGAISWVLRAIFNHFHGKKSS